MSFLFCGKGGIRTPGASQHGGFQDRCNRPLYHLSKLLCQEGFVFESDAKVLLFFEYAKTFVYFLIKRFIRFS